MQNNNPDILERLNALEQSLNPENVNITDHSWGLVLSGGGGKGAYQLGVYRALIESGLFACINGISGASIGAINAVLFAMNDYDIALKAWSSINPELFLSPREIPDTLLKDVSDVISGIADNTIIGSISELAHTNGIFSRDGLLKLLRANIDYHRISSSPYAIYANAITGEQSDSNVKYFALNDRTPEMIEDIILASSALPYIYEPVMIDGLPYRDGGLLDNIPVRPLAELGMKHIIVVRLDPASHIPYSYADSADYIDIAPSRDIGAFLDGTMDFNAKNVSMRLELGYRDALRAIKHYKYKKAGISLSPSEIFKAEEADFAIVRSIIKKEELQVNIDSHMNKLNDIISRYKL